MTTLSCPIRPTLTLCNQIESRRRDGTEDDGDDGLPSDSNIEVRSSVHDFLPAWHHVKHTIDRPLALLRDGLDLRTRSIVC